MKDLDVEIKRNLYLLGERIQGNVLYNKLDILNIAEEFLKKGIRIAEEIPLAEKEKQKKKYDSIEWLSVKKNTDVLNNLKPNKHILFKDSNDTIFIGFYNPNTKKFKDTSWHEKSKVIHFCIINI